MQKPKLYYFPETSDRKAILIFDSGYSEPDGKRIGYIHIYELKRVFQQVRWMNNSENMDITLIGTYQVPILARLGIKQLKKCGETLFYCVNEGLLKKSLSTWFATTTATPQNQHPTRQQNPKLSTTYIRLI